MSHFAELNEANEVVRVIIGDNDLPNEGYDWVVENLGGRWVQTSYNNNFRKRFAAVGMTYSEELDAFIPPKPFESWTFNNETADWDAPKPFPADGKLYYWDEENLDWAEVTDGNA